MKKLLEIKLLELVWIVLSVISIISIILFTLGIFSSILVLIISFAVLVLLFVVFRPKIVFKDERFDKWIILILAIALVFRLSPWQDFEGGQDQGIYMIMSGLIEREGDTVVEDRLIDRLSEEDRYVYEEEKGWLSSTALRKTGDESYQYIFYPLFPSLMAITSFVFGESMRLYTLTFFSIFSILTVYLLGAELGKSKKVGYMAAILLAISPLHYYFSRFTVTEVLMLTFNMSILYYLWLGFKEKNNLYLVLSFLIFILLLFTKITGIVMVVYLSIVFFILLNYIKKEEYKKYILLYSGYVFMFVVSLLFYKYKIFHLYSKFYVRDIFSIVPEWVFYSLISSLPAFMFILTKYLSKYFKAILEYLFKYKSLILYLVFSITVVAGFYFFYQMAFTDMYMETLFNRFWGMAMGGWIVLKDTVLMSFLLYFTPIAIFFILYFFKKEKDIKSILLAIFFLVFFAFNVFINKFTPYHYYYARYLLSEVYPVGTIMVAMAFYMIKDSYIWKINVKWFFLSLFVIYSLIFSISQLQGPHGADEDFFVDGIAPLIENKEKDLIVYYEPTKFSYSYIFAPLRDFYGYNSIRTGMESNFNQYITNLPQYYDGNIYILTSQELEQNDKVQRVSTIEYEKRFYAAVPSPQPEMTYTVSNIQIPYCSNYLSERYCSGILPLRYHIAVKNMYLYRVK